MEDCDLCSSPRAWLRIEERDGFGVSRQSIRILEVDHEENCWQSPGTDLSVAPSHSYDVCAHGHVRETGRTGDRIKVCLLGPVGGGKSQLRETLMRIQVSPLAGSGGQATPFANVRLMSTGNPFSPLPAKSRKTIIATQATSGYGLRETIERRLQNIFETSSVFGTSDDVIAGFEAVLHNALRATNEGQVYTDEQLTPTNKWNFDNSTVTEDITLYAKWTEDSYTVTFDAKGGSPTPPSQSKHYGDRVEEPSGVTRDGYTLEGWYTDEQLTPTKKWDFVNNPVTESITLYAKWIVLHTVTFHPNNGESDFTETVEEGKFANGPTSEPIREGFTFGGWYTDDGAWTDKWDLATHPVTANVDLFAKWNPKTYDFVVIVLDENGNPIEGATVIIKDKPSLTASDGKAHYKLTEGADYSCSVSKKGYIQGSGTFKIPLEGEITITLKSAPPSYTVTIDLQDGSSPTKHGVAPEEKFPQPSTPLRSGYLFVVWTTDREGTHPYNFETPVTGDLTLYAQWKKDSQIDAVEALTEVTMAPNPFSSTLRLEHAERILHLVVYTATGHRLVELAHSGAPSIVLNTSHWVGGLYLIRVTGAEGSRVLTAVKH